MRGLLLFALSLPLLAQDPSLIVAAGGLFNGAATPKIAGWTSLAFAARPGLYSITTLDQALTGRSLRTGIAQKVWTRGPFTGFIHADAGITSATLTGTTNALGSFSGGPMGTWKLPGHVYLIGVVRFVAVTSVSVRPVYELGFAWGIP